MRTEDSKKLELRNDLTELPRAREEIQEFVAGVFSSVELNRLLLAVDEAVANIIEHGYPPGAQETITLEMRKETDRFIFILEDNAEPFDPTRLESPDLEEHARAGRDSGLGVYLYTTILEASHESLGERGNRLTLVKRF